MSLAIVRPRKPNYGFLRQLLFRLWMAAPCPGGNGFPRRSRGPVPFRCVSLVLALCLGGCASQSALTLRYEAVPGGPYVWPPPPEPERIHFVGQLTGESDFQRVDGRERGNQVGKFFRWLVGLATGPVQPNVLQRPQGILVDQEGRIYVADVSRQAVQVFDVVTNEFKTWELAAAPNVQFKLPIALAQGPNGSILVTDSGHGYVVVLDATGKPVAKWGEHSLMHPTGIARDGRSGETFVADTRQNQVLVFDDQGQLLRRFGERGEGPGQLNGPTYIAYAQGQVFVSDTLNARIQIFDTQGRFLRSFGQRGLFVGNMTRPKGVAVDGLGLVYVVESYYDHLLVFNAQGDFLLPIGGTGSGAGQFYLPAGVAVDNNNRIYIADMFNGRVVIFQLIEGGA